MIDAPDHHPSGIRVFWAFIGPSHNLGRLIHHFNAAQSLVESLINLLLGRLRFFFWLNKFIHKSAAERSMFQSKYVIWWSLQQWNDAPKMFSRKFCRFWCIIRIKQFSRFYSREKCANVMSHGPRLPDGKRMEKLHSDERKNKQKKKRERSSNRVKYMRPAREISNHSDSMVQRALFFKAIFVSYSVN